MSAVMKICTACDQAKELSEFGKELDALMNEMNMELVA